MNTIIKLVISVVVHLATTLSCLAGTWTLMTDPTYVTDASGRYYVPVNKTYASSDGVTFTLNSSVINGYVTNLNWSFVNGSPGTFTSSPVTVKYTSSAAYGAANPFTFSFQHIGSGTSGLCSTPGKTNYVNVVKPQLLFNTSTTWASSNSIATSWATTLHFITIPPTVGVVTAYAVNQQGGGTASFHGTPYEYRMSALPTLSGALNTDFAIQEVDVVTETAYDVNGVATPLPGTTKYGTYAAGSFDVCESGPTGPPASPQVYACDSPGQNDEGMEASAIAYDATKVVLTSTLTSTPLYQTSSNPPDTSLASSTSFTLVFRTNGTGGMTWQNN